jgi:hypothetical protein
MPLSAISWRPVLVVEEAVVLPASEIKSYTTNNIKTTKIPSDYQQK